MCVIAICIDKRVPEDEFKEAFRINKDGAGFAWRTDTNVRYIKGLMNVEEAWMAYQREVPAGIFPHVVHFRQGSPVVPDLTHPFICNEESDLILNYEGNESLLFHNGVVGLWKDKLLDLFLRRGKIIEGEWSDTRMVACMIHDVGKDVLKWIEGKYVYYNMVDCNFWGSWEKKEEGIIWSNRSYVPAKNYYPKKVKNAYTPVENLFKKKDEYKNDPIKDIDYGHLNSIEDLRNGMEFMV